MLGIVFSKLLYEAVQDDSVPEGFDVGEVPCRVTLCDRSTRVFSEVCHTPNLVQNMVVEFFVCHAMDKASEVNDWI
jgi:hypothetical protein